MGDTRPGDKKTKDWSEAGRWMRTLREERGMTQQQLSKTTRVALRTVQRLEAGSAISPSTLNSLAEGLGVQPKSIKFAGASAKAVGQDEEGVTDPELAEMVLRAKPHKEARLQAYADAASLVRQAEAALAALGIQDAEGVYEFVEEATRNRFSTRRFRLSLSRGRIECSEFLDNGDGVDVEMECPLAAARPEIQLKMQAAVRPLVKAAVRHYYPDAISNEDLGW